VARRKKGESPQSYGNTISTFRGISPSTKTLIALLQGVTGRTSGEVVNHAIEAFTFFLANDARLSEGRRTWCRDHLLRLLKILPAKYLGEESLDGDGAGI
jgi:hypothetical protein